MRFAATLTAASMAAALAGCATGPAGFPFEPSTARLASAADGPVGTETMPRPGLRPALSQAAARATVAPVQAANEQDEAIPLVALTPQILYQLLAADMAAQSGDQGVAFNTYLKLARETRDPRLARRAAEIAIGARAPEQALQAARLWREISPASRPAAQMFETLGLATGKFSEVEPLLVARLAQARADGTLPVAYGQLQRALQRAQDRRGAWELVQRLSEPDMAVPSARLARAALAAAADHFDTAFAEAREAMRLDADNEEAVVTAARHAQRLPQGSARALELLEAFLQRAPGAAEARMMQARLLLAEGRSEDARAQFERVLAQYPENPLVLLSLAQIAHQNRQTAQAQQLLTRYVQLPRTVQRDNAIAFLFLAQIAEEEKRIEDALAWLGRVPRGDEYVSAAVRRARLLAQTNRLADARELLQRTRGSTLRERVQLVTGEAGLLREARLHQDAFDVLARGLERLPDNPDLLYDHAMAAERLDKLDVMEASLRRVIEIRPESAHAYNALGYTFADRSIRLDEARELLSKALQLAPNDAHILDSMGWLLFRQQNLPMALEYLRKAYAIQPEAEIAVHLGEVLWAMGNADEAKKYWREAQGREPDNSTLRETLARFNVDL
jgi:tetratricopeptide (TPR) repeat protein